VVLELGRQGRFQLQDFCAEEMLLGVRYLVGEAEVAHSFTGLLLLLLFCSGSGICSGSGVG